MTDTFLPFLQKVLDGTTLNQEQAYQAFNQLLSGEVSDVQVSAFLTAIKIRGESADEVTGAVKAMRVAMTKIKAPEGAIDVVGTGGDGAHTYNISTASAFVAAACGAKVAKHGNRSVSSLTGASDVLTALGVNINAAFQLIEKSIDTLGIGYLSAVKHHPALRHVSPVRQALGVRTIFNIIGPLSNPAGTKYQLIGTYARNLQIPMAQTLANLGSIHAWIVHGLEDGIDELSISGPSRVVELKDGEIRDFKITPEEVGLTSAPLSAIRGGDAQENAHALRAILEGDKNAYADIVALNSGACLLVAGIVKDLQSGVKAAQDAMASGAALSVLNKLSMLTNNPESLL